jgi:hypothetical protein
LSDIGVAVQEEAVGIHARHVLVLSQAMFFCCLVACFLIDHGAAAQNDGISFYGVYAPTILILVVGFTCAAVGLWRTASYFARTDAPAFSVVGLRVLALGLVALLVTPFNRGTFLNWAHMTAGVSMSLVQLGIVALLLMRRRTFSSVCGLVVQLAGGVISAASLPDWHFAYLLQGETLFEIGFGLCLIQWTYAVLARSEDVVSARSEG